MSKNYNDIMKNITLSDEARNRILENVSKAAESDKDIDTKNENNKIVPIRNWKKAGSIAATLAVVVLGGSIIMLQTTQKSSDTAEMAAMDSGTTDYTDESSAREYALMESADASPNYKSEDSDYATPDYEAETEGSAVTIENPMVEYSSLSELSKAIGFSVKELDELPFEVTSITYYTINDIAQVTYYGADDKEVCFRQSKTLDVDISGVYEGSDLNACIWQDDDFNYSIVTDSSITKSEIKKMKTCLK